MELNGPTTEWIESGDSNLEIGINEYPTRPSYLRKVISPRPNSRLPLRAGIGEPGEALTRLPISSNG